MNKYLKEVVTHRALDFKLSGNVGGDAGEDLMEDAIKKSGNFKNVCAQLPEPMVKEFEGIINVLGLSKRQFITMAIQSAMDEAQEVMDEIDITEYLREAREAKEQS